MMGRWIKGSGWYPNFRQPQLFRKGAMRYTLEPVHEGYEILSGKPVGTLTNAIWQFPFRNLEEVIQQDEPLFLARRAEARRQARVDGGRARPRRVVVPQALHFQARLHRRLGRLRHRAWEISKARSTATPSATKQTQDWQPPESKPIKREALARLRRARALDHVAGRMPRHEIDQDDLRRPAPRRCSRPTTCSRV